MFQRNKDTYINLVLKTKQQDTILLRFWVIDLLFIHFHDLWKLVNYSEYASKLFLTLISLLVAVYTFPET